jgi:hypothetical protein
MLSCKPSLPSRVFINERLTKLSATKAQMLNSSEHTHENTKYEGHPSIVAYKSQKPALVSRARSEQAIRLEESKRLAILRN